ncbi:hypothetical protein RRG08_008352 [Elysia crispata]|uniref:Uncharacterized protein n=1 Tax=Elysia crispata TaxID=231223 RepID=A0AAE0YUQ9_9GAST|nr:hypothetical protein RRG08_008352 [Elysia crispata]
MVNIGTSSMAVRKGTQYNAQNLWSARIVRFSYLPSQTHSSRLSNNKARPDFETQISRLNRPRSQLPNKYKTSWLVLVKFATNNPIDKYTSSRLQFGRRVTKTIEVFSRSKADLQSKQSCPNAPKSNLDLDLARIIHRNPSRPSSTRWVQHYHIYKSVLGRNPAMIMHHGLQNQGADQTRLDLINETNLVKI